MRHASANPSTAQTNTVLVALAAGRQVKAKFVYISSDTAMTVTVLDSVGHNVLWRQYVAADGGSVAEGRELFKSIKGEGLDYTTSATGNVFLKVGYEMV